MTRHPDSTQPADTTPPRWAVTLAIVIVRVLETYRRVVPGVRSDQNRQEFNVGPVAWGAPIFLLVAIAVGSVLWSVWRAWTRVGSWVRRLRGDSS